MFMRQVYRTFYGVLLASGLFFVNPVWADALADGQNALMRGDDGGAIRLWTPPALEGNPEAQFRLGLMYLGGRGVARDQKMAVRWFKMALEKRHIGASLSLARLYMDKAGTSYDPETALSLLRDVADQGVTEAQRYLGELYRKGGDVAQDFDEARRWYQLAAAKGDIKILVSSDHMARGIDLPNIKLIVNYDPPKHAKTYVHRVGRTARANRYGHSLTLLKEGQVGVFRKMRATINTQEQQDEHKDQKIGGLLKCKVNADLEKLVEPIYAKALKQLSDVMVKESRGELTVGADLTF